MFQKVLVANRGEIAIRALRAGHELGARTVAVFPHEDRNSLHRLKADEAYQIGEPGHPVRAYLSAEEIVRAAVESGADAVYPGYGFLSENPGLARACAEAGITFVGPPAEVLELTGDKTGAIAAARSAGGSVPPSRAAAAGRAGHGARPRRGAAAGAGAGGGGCALAAAAEAAAGRGARRGAPAASTGGRR